MRIKKRHDQFIGTGGRKEVNARRHEGTFCSNGSVLYLGGVVTLVNTGLKAL